MPCGISIEMEKIAWKASPRFLMMLADAERDARDDLAELAIASGDQGATAGDKAR